MKVLIIGSGGREHAIGWKIKKDNPYTEMYFYPGNAGTAELGENLPGPLSLTGLCTWAKSQEVDLTIVGPEKELAEGIVDIFQDEGLTIFGPEKKDAILESSKTFAKQFMEKHGVKTPDYHEFRHYVDAKDYLENVKSYPIVIKADGLAAGKGVVIAHDYYDAKKAIKNMMKEKAFGDAGSKVVIEEFVKGYEVSILSIFNGDKIVPFISARDHKKIGEGDTGLNTGGMGVVAPNPLFTEENNRDFIENILKPTEEGLKKENMRFSGVIFFGLIVNDFGVNLLEYNVRFGDPETQAVLPLMKNNLLEIIQKSVSKEDIEIQWSDQNSCCVVMASGGYPLNYEVGFTIEGIEKVDSPVFLAGVKKWDNEYVTAGGRVLSVVGVEENAELARARAYEGVNAIKFAYEYYRKDIGETE